MDEQQTVRSVRLEPHGDGFRATIGDGEYQVTQVQASPGSPMQLILHKSGCGPSGDRRLRVYVAQDGPRRFVHLGGMGTYTVQRAESARRARDIRGGEGNLEAAMPGQVRDVLVREGEEVTRGQSLVILEAMKMELKVQSPFNGHVRKVLCQTGDVVERGQRLVEIEET